MHVPTLQRQFATTHAQLQHALTGFTDENSLIAPQDGRNSARWLLAHLVASRQVPLILTGEATVWDPARLQRWGHNAVALTDPGEAIPLEPLRMDLETSQAALMTRLSALSEADLAEPTPLGSVGAVLAYLVTHEAHHIGQLVALRRTLGL